MSGSGHSCLPIRIGKTNDVRLNRNVPVRQRGFVLLPVILLIALLATAIFLLSRDNASGLASGASEAEATKARYVAEAGFQHAQWRVNRANCSNYTDITNEPFGEHSYTVVVSPTGGSPISLQSTGNLASSARRLFGRDSVPVYDLAAPVTGTLIPGPEGKDSFIDGDPGNQNHNKGTDNELWTSSLTGKEYRSLLQFDLSGLPPAAAIQSATLELYLSNNTSSDTVEAHRLLRDWTELGVTWISYDGTSGWNTPGGDYDPAVAGSFLADTVGPKSMDITDAAKAWAEGLQANYGLILISPPNAGGNTNKYHSTDKSGEPYPRLTLTYVCECGTPCPGITVVKNVVLSTDSDAILAGLSFTDVDIAEYNPATDTAELLFDGGTTTLDKDINAIHVLENGHIVLSTKDDATIGGLSFKNEDLVEYDPLTDTATMYFDGSLHFAEDENIISVHILRSGNLVLSTDSEAALGGVTFSDKDLVKYNPTSNKASIYFDGDATTLSDDITAVHVLENGHIVMAAKGSTTLGGLSFTPADLIEYNRATDTAILYFPGSSLFDDAGEEIISAHINGDNGPTGEILLVVGNAASPASKDSDRKSQFESWGYTVTLVDDGDSQANFDAAVAANDVVYVADSIADGTLADKLTDATVGIVSEEGLKLDDFGFGSDVPPITTSWNAFTATDAAHYISEPFAGAGVTQFTQNLTMPLPKGTKAPGMQAAGLIGAQQLLVTLEVGAERWDSAPSTGRRVHLPFGAANISQLTADGLTLLHRSLEWAEGAGPNMLAPFAHWKLDDGSGLAAIDSVGGHDGTLVSNPDWVTGRLNGALDFNGTSDYVDAGTFDVPGSGITLMGWFNADALPAITDPRIVSKASSTAEADAWWQLSILTSTSNRNIRLRVKAGGITTTLIDSTTNLNAGAWYFAVGTYDAASGEMKLYLNGAEVASRSHPAGGAVDQSAVTPVAIGANGSAEQLFDGILDDVRIYRRALSETEITDLYDDGLGGPIAHWKLDDGTGLTAVDSEGGHDGAVNGAAWTVGQLGDALDFDGSNDYVDLTSDTELDDVFAGGATVMAWIEPAGWGNNGYGRIFDKSSSPSATGNGWALRMNVDNGGLNFGQGFTSGRGWWRFAESSISLGSWQHIAVAYDASLTANDPVVYLNGSPVAVTQVDTPSGAVLADAAISLHLGNHASSAATFFDGKIDDARIYDRMLSAAEIAEIADIGAGGGGGGACAGTFRDEFNTKTYSANDGTLSWSTDWLEVGESDGPQAGDEQVVNDQSDFQLRTQDNDNGGEGAEREADLSGAVNATLTYDYRRKNLDNANDYTTVEVSANGGSGPWTEIARYEGPGSDSIYQSVTHNIAGFVSANTRIRFKTSSNMGGTDNVYFDNIEIACTP